MSAPARGTRGSGSAAGSLMPASRAKQAEHNGTGDSLGTMRVSAAHDLQNRALQTRQVRSSETTGVRPQPSHGLRSVSLVMSLASLAPKLEMASPHEAAPPPLPPPDATPVAGTPLEPATTPPPAPPAVVGPRGGTGGGVPGVDVAAAVSPEAPPGPSAAPPPPNMSVIP